MTLTPVPVTHFVSSSSTLLVPSSDVGTVTENLATVTQCVSPSSAVPVPPSDVGIVTENLATVTQCVSPSSAVPVPPSDVGTVTENLATVTQCATVTRCASSSSALSMPSCSFMTSASTLTDGRPKSVSEILKVISPKPKIQAQRVRKRKAEGAVNLTGTPNKVMLEAKKSEKSSSKSSNCKRSIIEKQPKKKGGNDRIAKKISKGKGKMDKKAKKQKCGDGDSDEEAEFYCLVCVEPFSNSCDREKWIACIACHMWSHQDCTDGNPNYISHLCDSDDD